MTIKLYIKRFLFKLLYDPTFNNCRLDTMDPNLLVIGKNFIAGANSAIYTHSAALLNKTGKQIKGKVTIGDNVFLGAGSVIMPGVKIGDNVIIGANCVVTRNIKSDKVVGGNPMIELCSVENYLRFIKINPNFTLC